MMKEEIIDKILNFKIETMINLDLDESELSLLVQTLNEAVSSTASENTKEKIKTIVERIIFADKLDKLIFKLVEEFLKAVTASPITPTKNLEFDLGINKLWIRDSLKFRCDDAVQTLLANAGSTAKAKKTTSAQAVACKTVQDIINLIKKIYETAK